MRAHLRVVPEDASADHARPARIGAVPLHLLRAGAAEPQSRSDPLRRAAVVCQLRDDAADQVRHARRVDARLRRHVVAGLPGVHVVEPQRHAPDVRDVRQRRRDDDEAQRRRRPDGGAGQTSREWYRPLPPYKEVVWSMRNNTNYMETAVLSALQYAASFPRRASSRTSTGRAATASRPGKKEAPYAFVVPGGPEGPDARRPAGLRCCAGRASRWPGAPVS